MYVIGTSFGTKATLQERSVTEREIGNFWLGKSWLFLVVITIFYLSVKFIVYI